VFGWLRYILGGTPKASERSELYQQWTGESELPSETVPKGSSGSLRRSLLERGRPTSGLWNQLLRLRRLRARSWKGVWSLRKRRRRFWLGFKRLVLVREGWESF